MRYATNPEIDEYLGLGDYSDDCRAQIAGYPARYVFAGSVVRYQASPVFSVTLGMSSGSLDKGAIAAVANSVLADVRVDVDSSLLGGQATVTITGTASVDFSDLTDIQGLLTSAIESLGYQVGNSQIGPLSSPNANVICGPGGGFKMGATPPPAVSSGATDYWQQLKSDLDVSGTTLGIAAAIIGVVVFISVVKK